MKVTNTRKVNERIVQYMSREQLNSLLGMGLSAPVSVDEIIFEEPAKLLSYWIEDALIATIIGFVYMIILEEFYKNQGIDAPKVSDLPDDEAYKLEYLKDLLRDAEITRPKHVDYYMDYHNIINLMS